MNILHRKERTFMNCYRHELKNKIIDKKPNDKAFMGYTHALSGVAVAMALIAFLPEFLGQILMTTSIWVFIQFLFATTGAAMLPDLDNSKSRAKSDLGPFGIVLSGFFRVSSAIIQTTIRTKRDDPEPNPHRGFWHTIPASLLLGFLVYLGTRMGGEINIPILGLITWGTLFALLITFTLMHLTLSTLAKEFMDKVKKSNATGEIIAVAISLILSVILFVNLPTDIDFWWLGVSVAFGMFVHILGDLNTTAGVAIGFPLTAITHGKFWWTFRLTKMKAGGAAEKMLVVPILTVIIVISFVKIAIGLF